MTKSSIFFFAGEPSGDLHGGHLLDALKAHMPLSSFTGVGGPKMRLAGLECIMPMEKFAVMGFSDVFRALPRLVRQFYEIRDQILIHNPHAVIFIDYPGFNLRMAGALRKKGYQGKLIHYICPSIWAWGKGRIQKMVKTLDLLLTIYPFEKSYFENTSLKVCYVGNPLKEKISSYVYQTDWAERLGIPKVHLIGLFPGSRKGEIERNFPKQIEAIALYKKDKPQISVAISCANEESQKLIRHLIQGSSLKLGSDVFIVPPRYTYELMKDARTTIAKSGTVTLELALHHRPSVVMYELSLLNRFIAKNILRLKLPYYCIVNILENKLVFPELIQAKFSSLELADQLAALDQEGTARQKCIRECAEVSILLKEFQTSELACQRIKELLHDES